MKRGLEKPEVDYLRTVGFKGKLSGNVKGGDGDRLHIQTSHYYNSRDNAKIHQERETKDISKDVRLAVATGCLGVTTIIGAAGYVNGSFERAWNFCQEFMFTAKSSSLDNVDLALTLATLGSAIVTAFVFRSWLNKRREHQALKSF